MLYVMVGLACSAVGCEWWKPAFKETFDTEKACLARAAEIQPKQLSFFKIKCEPAAAAVGGS